MNNCKEFAALLDPYIDDFLSTEDRWQVQAHLETCPACRAYVEDALAIRSAFPAIEEAEVPEGFAEGVAAAIRADAAPRKRRLAPWGRVLVPLAACLAVAVIAVGGLPPWSGGDMAASTAGSGSLSPMSEPKAAPADGALMDAAPQTETAVEDSLPETAVTESGSEPTLFANTSALEPVDGPIFAEISVSQEDAGDFFLDQTPVEETDLGRVYRLSAADYDAFLDHLAQSGGAYNSAVPDSKPDSHPEVLPEEPAEEGYALVTVLP